MRFASFLPRVAAGLLFCASAALSGSEPLLQNDVPPIDSGSGRGRGFRNLGDPDEDRILHELAEKRNAERQRSLVEDTQKLVKLAGELNSTMNAESDDRVSPENIKKVEEVERLARQVRDKMVGY